MLELAITQGADFVRYTRNAKAIELPDGATVLGPLASFPHLVGDFAIREVVVDGPEAGPLEIAGTEPPVVDGDVVVIRRTVSPMGADQIGAIKQQQADKRRDAIAAELTAIDAASARPLRAIIASTSTQADHDRLIELESQAAALRAELASLS